MYSIHDNSTKYSCIFAACLFFELLPFAIHVNNMGILTKYLINSLHLFFFGKGRDGADVISTLRSGSAVVNAAALMKERGYTNRRRSRHRLTPGTVKFAAFHVLSLEGGKGLTILEVAEKIQVYPL